MYIDNSQYDFPIIVSNRSRKRSSVPEIAELCEALAPAVLHMTALEEAPKTRAERAAMKRLRRLVENGSLTLWNGGFAGAPATLLTTAELDWERCWGLTNRWDTGLEQLFESPAAAFFPNGVVAANAVWIEDRARMPICGGYRDTESNPLRPIYILEGGRWSTLSALMVTDDQRPATNRAFEIVHIATDGRNGTSAELLALIRSISASRRQTGSGSDGTNGTGSIIDIPPFTRLVNGLDLRSEASILVASAVATVLRGQVQGVSERAREVLLGSRGSTATAAPPAEMRPEVVRELQGMTGGMTEIIETFLRARFAAGRPAGLTIDSHEILLPIRSQGWAQALNGGRPATVWLESDAAAWFTTFSTRGIQESSHLSLTPEGPTITVGTRSTVSEQLPALRVHVEVSFPDELPDGRWAIEPIQIPIAFFAESTEIEVLAISDPGREITDRLSVRDLPCTIFASALRITTGKQTILCAIDGAAATGMFFLSPGAPSRDGRTRRMSRSDTSRRILWLSPTISIRGTIPPELAGTSIGATYLIADGSHDPALLRRLSERDEVALSWMRRSKR